MPQCEILETFKGSQDGRFTETFHAGTVVDVSAYLIPLAPKGALRVVENKKSAEYITANSVDQSPSVENKATITTGSRGKK